MRRTLNLLRGKNSHGWYEEYRKHPDKFEFYTKLTPFNWESPKPAIERPTVTFQFATKREEFGTVEFELAYDVLPQTVTNFLRLTRGIGPKGFTYKGSLVHQVQKGEFLMAGDVTGGGGRFSHSSYEYPFFEDENFIIPHTGPGLLR